MSEQDPSAAEKVEFGARAVEELRATRAEERSRWYSPICHLMGPTIFGLSLCCIGALLLEDALWWEWMTVPAIWVFSNFIEWHAHRDLLHTRSQRIPILYEGHTLNHHMVFASHDMAVRERGEWREVLLPPLAVVMLVGLLVPVFAVLWFAGLPNVACFYMMTGTLYVLSYEWLHLSYHLHPESWIGRRGFIRFLRRHHSVHHDPSLMQRWNMNVTVPLWDWVRGTIADKDAAAEALRPR